MTLRSARGHSRRKLAIRISSVPATGGSKPFDVQGVAIRKRKTARFEVRIVQEVGLHRVSGSAAECEDAA